MTTAYITHPVFKQHDMGIGHPECPARLAAIEDQLIEEGLFDLLQHYEPPEASRAQLERVHCKSYIDDLEQLAPGKGMVALDPDTWMNPYTLEAARRAAGATIMAIDLVMRGEVNNAFCAVRPPGHHAEQHSAMGFCFFNNIACAAMHALDQYPLSRIAIIDFDVHHGNGTEDILRNEDRALFCSSFQHPFYPDRPFAQDNPHIICLPLPGGTRGMDFRESVSGMWLPALERFAPELILVSAGFDAHRDDPLADMLLTERDFAWITYEIMELAKRFAEGRVISTLEGGYNLNALGHSAATHIKILAGLDGG